MRKTLKKRLKKDQILFSAVSVINRNGYENTTMEDISRELQMTKGSLYYYFKNKDDLIYQCHTLVLSLATKELEDILQKEDITAEETLRKMVSTHIEYAIEEREIFNLIFEPKSTFNKEQLEPVLKLRKYYSRLFDEAIQQGIDHKEFQVKDPILVRMMILGAMNWVQQWYDPNGKLSKSELKERYGDYIIKLVN
ncbi:TetR/AcrR family transcriptional regulator [Oceanobacillus saliphilus]|uniref:TetR/AcrR family transcriptional regulator n=1 Tax=Oceanobacillus saliphilus TaxID=2925834 RepID=UPI00201DCCB4